MKQLKNMSLLIGLATLGISTANAGVYVGADVGYSRIHTSKITYPPKFPNSSGVIDSSNKNKDLESIKLGYSFNNGLRTEIALTRYGNINNSYALNDKVDINRSIKSGSLMVNAYYDFNKTSTLQPYIMGGIGLGINKTGFEVSIPIGKWEDSNNTRNAFAYQVGAGASYKLADQWYADAGIKYAYLGKSSTNSAIISKSAKVSSVDTTIGIRYAF